MNIAMPSDRPSFDDASWMQHKNPVVSKTKFAEIERRARKFAIKTVPKFAVDDENIKIPAAWLIENSGFHKGYKFGNVGLSTNHTLAIVNLGNAKAKDILDFKDEIQTKVKEKFDVDLKPEPVFVGFEIGQGQSAKAREHFESLKIFDKVECIKDLAGTDRHIIATISAKGATNG